MHIIRLRGPWELQPLARFVPQSDATYRVETDDLLPAAKAKMPADWSATLGEDFRGRVRYVRTFNKPTGLESGERVWLVVEPPRSVGAVTLNGQPLGDVAIERPPGRFEVTPLLDEHNRLEITVEHPRLDVPEIGKDDSNTQLAGGLVGEVRLEIQE